MRVTTFTLAKETPESNEDAVAWVSPSPETLRLAVADGASSDAFAGLWARQLVLDFMSHGALTPEVSAAAWRAAVATSSLPGFLRTRCAKERMPRFLGF